MAAIRKSKYDFKITDEGRWSGVNKNLIEEITQKFKGMAVSLTVEPIKRDKTLPQLGYFFGVVLPHYMYALIEAGNDFQIGNKVDEKIVENVIKERYLANGTEWSTPIKINLIAKDNGFVKNKTSPYVTKGAVAIKIINKNNYEQVSLVHSNIEGEIEAIFESGDLVNKGDIIARVNGVHIIKAAASLGDASTKQVVDMIDKLILDCAEFFNYVIPPPDPLRQEGGPMVRDELNKLLNQKRVARGLG
jgi:hypothetical protein